MLRLVYVTHYDGSKVSTHPVLLVTALETCKGSGEDGLGCLFNGSSGGVISTVARMARAQGAYNTVISLSQCISYQRCA